MSVNQSDVFTLMVDNEFGVLTRVTAMIRREGWNIRSLAVAETENPDVSRLTITLYRRHSTLKQVIDRLSRQTSVRRVTVFSPEDQVAQELTIVRLDNRDPAAVAALQSEHGMHYLGEAEGNALLSFSCLPDDTEKILEACRKVGLQDVARTGTITLRKTEKGE